MCVWYVWMCGLWCVCVCRRGDEAGVCVSVVWGTVWKLPTPDPMPHLNVNVLSPRASRSLLSVYRLAYM